MDVPRVAFRICRGCNGKLSREFESDNAALLSPLLVGSKVQLDQQEQARAAGWAVKTALLALYSEQIGLTPHKAEVCRHLLLHLMQDTRSVPFNALVRFASVVPHGRAPNTSPLFVNDVVPPTAHPPRRGIVDMFYAGYLGAQVIISSDKEIADFRASNEDDAWFTHLWPPESETV